MSLAPTSRHCSMLRLIASTAFELSGSLALNAASFLSFQSSHATSKIMVLTPPLVLNRRPPDDGLAYSCRRRKIQPITWSHSRATIPGRNLLPNLSRERGAPDQVDGCFQTSKAKHAETFIWPAPSSGVSTMDLAF